MCNLQAARKVRFQPEIVGRPFLALAHKVLPGLESLPCFTSWRRENKTYGKIQPVMNRLLEMVNAHADPSQVEGLSRFFKTGKGQYGEGDVFLGIKVPVTRAIVKETWKDVSFNDLEECIASRYHELRLAALLTLVQIFKHARKDQALRQRCVDFYLANTAYVNNWDLVDLSCYEILGPWLMDKDRSILYDLAKNGSTIWQQRIGIVSTMAFVRAGQFDDTLAIADILLSRPEPMHDLLQKAAGWLVREVGNHDEQIMKDWLEPRYPTMPRTMLRYCIEKLDDTDRLHFMQKTR